MGFPTISLEAAIGYGPLAAVPSGAWVNIGTIKSGSFIDPSRQRETDQFQAGRFTVVVDNTDRHLDPTNPASIGLTIGTPVRAYAVWAGGGYSLGFGYVDEVAPAWSNPSSDFATITCVDASPYLGTVNDTGYAATVIADGAVAYYRCDDTAASHTLADQIGGHDMAILNLPTSAGAVISSPADPLGGLPSLLVADVGHSFDMPGQGWVAKASMNPWLTSGNFTVEAWVVIDPAVTDTPILTISDNATAGFSFGIGSTYSAGHAAAGCPFLDVGNTSGDSYVAGATPINDFQPHHIAFRKSGSQFTLYVDGVSLGTITITAGLTVNHWITLATRNKAYFEAGAFIIDEIALYPTALATIATHANLGLRPWAGDTSSARVRRLLSMIGIPSAMLPVSSSRTVLPGLRADAFANGPIDVLAHLQKVAEAEGGRFFFDRDGYARFYGRAQPLSAPWTVSQATYSDVTDLVTGARPAGSLPYVTGGLRGSISAAEVDNQVSITRAAQSDTDAPVPQVVNDTASQAALKMVKTLTQTDQLNPTDAEANNKAHAILAQRSTPQFRIRELRLDPAATDLLWPEVLGRRIGELITVLRHPPGGGAPYSDQLRIEGRTLTISKLSITAAYVASKADTTTWMTIGGTIGGRLFW